MISASKMYVYVATDEEYKEYSEKLDKKLYNKLVVGIKGLVPQRQFIMEQWKEGQHIVFFDDDVESIDLSISKLFKGKTLDQAASIKNSEIAQELALPPVKIHCSILAEDAIKAAVSDYKQKHGQAQAIAA